MTLSLLPAFSCSASKVLRGQQRQHAGLFQLDQRLMRSAGLRIPYWRFLLPAPGVLAVLFVAQEQIDVVKRSFGQDAWSTHRPDRGNQGCRRTWKMPAPG
mgnify:CR=1 FL=1